MILSMLSQSLIVAFAGLVVWAAVSDLKRFIIPNRIVAAIAVLWLIHAAARLAAGAPGIHFYTMNTVEPTKSIWQNLKL